MTKNKFERQNLRATIVTVKNGTARPPCLVMLGREKRFPIETCRSHSTLRPCRARQKSASAFERTWAIR
jgi:hypothetical protein